MRGFLYRYFIPHDGNGYQPHVLQKAAMAGMMILILISFAVANFQSLLWVSSGWLVSTVLPAVVAMETNKARAIEGYQTLERSEVLDKAAQLKANDMANNEYFAHWSPAGVSPWHWFEEAGYEYTYAGENLAVHFTDSEAVVDAWLKSPTHRENIMNGNFSEIGIGTAKGKYEGHDTVFVVQMFGSPATGSISEVDDSTPVSDVAEVATADAPAVAGVSEEAPAYETFTATAKAGASPGMNNSAAVTFGKFATSPNNVLQLAYSIIGMFVVAALLLAVVIEWRRQHPIQIAYSVALLSIMIILFQVHLALSGGVIIA